MNRRRRIVLGLGSNVGEREAFLRMAIARLRETPGLDVVAVAHTYESAPAGGPPQGDYLNSAVLGVTSLAVRAILERALAVEAELGRQRKAGERNAPRTIDIDVLWIEGETYDEPALVVPHPRLCDRTFALRPLLDLVPEARDPRTGALLAELAAASAFIRRVA